MPRELGCLSIFPTISAVHSRGRKGRQGHKKAQAWQVGCDRTWDTQLLPVLWQDEEQLLCGFLRTPGQRAPRLVPEEQP